jgi:hypothetical protein
LPTTTIFDFRICRAVFPSGSLDCCIAGSSSVDRLIEELLEVAKTQPRTAIIKAFWEGKLAGIALERLSKKRNPPGPD